ncbi:MAG: NTP transferase domain-containing protein [Gemmobacter sp.]
MTVQPAILILAAGASSRMKGKDKLIEMVDGLPLLRRSACIALACGVPVVVVVPPDRPERVATLDGLPLHCVVAQDARLGMAASLRAGFGALRDTGAGAAMILPADMPDVTTADITRMLEAAAADPSAILRATAEDGTPGHPVILPADLWPELEALTGDEGGRSVVARHRDRLRLVALPGRRALTDLDTPEDWASWRAGGSGPHQ